jgi:hypothetical protein
MPQQVAIRRIFVQGRSLFVQSRSYFVLRQEVSKFEFVAGRVERDGHMGRRFVSAMQRPTLTRVLVAAALEQCG